MIKFVDPILYFLLTLQYTIVAIYGTGPPITTTSSTILSSTVNSTLKNVTNSDGTIVGKVPGLQLNKDTVLRMLYVLIGITAVVVLYFAIKTIRIHRRKSKTKKYGVITTPGEMEMTPLDQDDDDEDMTVFEVNHRR